jgi:DNA invertase Pin-like site-specific DNA recombinase
MFIGYARLSPQDADSSAQLDALNHAGCGRIFIETASGAQRERPELKAALNFLGTGDTLVVWRLDRLARSLKQLVETVESLAERNIGFRSLIESIDTTATGGQWITHVFGSLAVFERSIIRERTSAGLHEARAHGRKGGRPRTLSSQDLATAKALLSDPNVSIEDVAKRLNVGLSTLYRHLPGGRGAVLDGAL